MKFDPREFLDIAERINDASKKESEFRSVVNRAYYAAFGFGKQVVNITTTDASVHRDTYERLSRYEYEGAKKAGKMLESLFKRRKRADYTYHEPIRKWESEASIGEAREIIDRLKDCQSHWKENGYE